MESLRQQHSAVDAMASDRAAVLAVLPEVWGLYLAQNLLQSLPPDARDSDRMEVLQWIVRASPRSNFHTRMACNMAGLTLKQATDLVINAGAVGWVSIDCTVNVYACAGHRDNKACSTTVSLIKQKIN